MVLLVIGMGFLALHASVKSVELKQSLVEYRYLPLPLDQWFKEQQFSAFQVMNDMVETTTGYCSNAPVSTPAPPPLPTMGPSTGPSMQ